MFLTNQGRGVPEGGFDGTSDTCLHDRHLLASLGFKRSGQCQMHMTISF
jgi:hypothetical protein